MLTESTTSDDLMSSGESEESESLDWLLDEDYEEQKESLFSLSEDTFDSSLSESELQMAGRPMARGDAGADSLDTFVEEEIILGSVGESSDIYNNTADVQSEFPDKENEPQFETVAIEHVQPRSSHTLNQDIVGLDDGSDLLELADDDDMGEKPLVLQRSGARQALYPLAAAEETQTEIEDAPQLSTSEPEQVDANITVIQELPQIQQLPQEQVDTVVSGGVNQEIELLDDTLAAEPVEEPEALGSPLEFSSELTEPELNQIGETQATAAHVDTLDLEVEEESLMLDVLADSPENKVDHQSVSIGLSEPVEEIEETFDLGLFDESAFSNVSSESDALEEIAGADFTDIGELDIESLGVARVEGVAPLDPSTNDEIDYHEDFDQYEFDSADAVSIPAISEVLGPLMTAINTSIALKLQHLQEPPQSVQAEIVVVADEADLVARQREDYVPLTSLGIELPSDLDQLGQLEVDAIQVRLVRLASGQHCNDLFLTPASPTNPSVPGIDDESILDHEEGGTTQEYLLFADDEDIDEDFFTESNDFPDIVSRQQVVEDADIADFPIADSANDQDFDEAIDFSDLAAATETIFTTLEEQEVEDPELAAPEEVAQDIFGSDLEMDFAEDLSGKDSNEDELFASLSMGDMELDDICGITPEAFTDTPWSSAGESMPAPSSSNENIERENVAHRGSVSAEKSNWCVPEGITFSKASQDHSEVFGEFLDAFIEESATELEKLEDAFAEWEKKFESRILPDEVLRTLHTLKGIAKGVGLQCYGTLIHNFETLLEQVEIPEPGAEDAYFRLVNAWLNAAVQGFEHVETTREDIRSELPSQTVDVFAKLSDSSRSVIETPEDTELSSIDSSATIEPVEQNQAEKQMKPDALTEPNVKPLADQQTIRMTADAVDHLMNLTNQAQQLGVRSSQSTVRSKLATSELHARLSSVRTNVNQIADKALLNVTAKGGAQTSDLDALEMDQYSEIQEAANILREGVEDLSELIAQTNRQNSMVEALLKQQASVISSLRGSIQATRVIPVSRLMPSLRRIIRTVSADLGKAVSFRVLQEIGSLDRDSHGRCQTILEHMVRNAMDHGIESAEQRVLAGKSANGQITIDVRKEGSDYVITLTDDGRGMDPDALREVAFKRGLDIDVDALSDEEALRLIFHRGFSTAATVSEVSGRGVGMDVVLAEVQQLGGSIDISSELGRGTTFSIRVPSNLTVNGALLVTSAEESYAIPLDGLIAVEHVPVEDFFEAVSHRSTLPLFGLDCEPTYLATLCSGKSLPDRNAWGATVPVIVAGSDRRTMAIAIDDVKQALELVIRSLGSQFASVPGLAGGATTADGQAIVALDLNSLVESIGDESQSTISVSSEVRERMLVAVVDDSRTQRMVATSQFDKLGVETVTAENGLIAIDQLNNSHRLPDVILLDIEMPVKDGIQTLREIRKSPRLCHIPVIMVTSRTGAKHRRLAEEAGCNEFMGKPFNFPLLVQRINALTGHELQLN
ncbi:MAG: response regulator [Halioglobus sp.]